jgi:two-component system sensor histidine kinase/response regulator
LAKKEHPNLILLDVKMPGMSGLDVFYALKEDQELKDTPIAFLTAFSDPTMPEVDLASLKELERLIL